MNINDNASADIPDSEPPFVLPAPRRFRTADLIGAALAWLIIIGIVGFRFVAPQVGAAVKAPSRGPDFVFDFQSRYLVGASEIQGGAGKQALANQVSASSPNQKGRRLREAVLAGELGGADAALERLKTDRQVQSNRIADILFRLYKDYKDEHWDAPHVTPAEKQSVREVLGWYGDLALAPEHGPDLEARDAALAPARRTFFSALAFIGVGMAILGVGTISLFVLFIAWLLHKIHSGVFLGMGHSALWVQTFALYMFLYVGLGLAASLMGLSNLNRLKLSGPLALLSLSALFWPRLRGMSWAEIRRDIGWTTGRGLIREIVAGPAIYVMTMPLAAVGVMITLLLMALTRKVSGGALSESPVHPVVPILPGAGLELKVIIFVLAAIIAPIVEETMFRGVIYRHLREGTRKFGGVWSFLASALLTSFIFAAIHPQGWRGIPPLMGIAMGLNLAREWRGSLIPSMIAHGINNGLVMAIVLVAVG